MRVAPVPLYNSFTDVQRFCMLLKEAIETTTQEEDGGLIIRT